MKHTTSSVVAASLGSLAFVTATLLSGRYALVKARDIARRTRDLKDRQFTELADLRAQLTRIERATNANDRRLRGLRASVTAESIELYRQLLAARDIELLAGVHTQIHNLRGWAISPDALLFAMRYMLAHRPSLVVELGSGSSTSILAQFLETSDLSTRIVSVDHDHDFFEQTSSRISSDHVTLVEAPLVSEGREYPWYDSSRILAALGEQKIDLLIVDGPPGHSSPEARKPVLTELRSVLADDYTLLLDDSKRPDERAAVEAWLELDPRLKRFEVIAEKGLTMLTTKDIDFGALL